MSKDMLGSLVRAAVRLTQPQVSVSLDIMNRFTGEDGEAWEKRIKSVLRAGLSGGAHAEDEKLLRFIRPVSLPAIPKFVAAEKFREGETVDGIKVTWLGDNFKTNFLKKVEDPVPALEMREYKLVGAFRDPAIVTELGGEEQVETTLGQFWEFLKTADQTLVHVRHIRDVNSVLWAFDGYWRDGGLNAEALPLDCPDGWRVGGRFLSR